MSDAEDLEVAAGRTVLVTVRLDGSSASQD
jgi:hypothetical protein